MTGFPGINWLESTYEVYIEMLQDKFGGYIILKEI